MPPMSASAARGILPGQAIAALAGTGALAADLAFAPDQIQPASVDLRLGTRGWRVRASFLPGPQVKVRDRLSALALHEIDLTTGAVLETGCVYVVELLERLKLPDDVAAAANPKSSTGRLDVFTRIIADGMRAFDQLPEGYAGPLYLEVSPRTFPILVRTGSRLSQLRLRRGAAVVLGAELARLQEEQRLVDTKDPDFRSGGIAVSIDLSERDGVVGWRAKRHTGLVDVDKRAACEVLDYWEPLTRVGHPGLVLDPDEFYILASKEAVQVPPAFAAEMVPFDPLVGEFRVHYAGFFDPGFGWAPAGGAGARAVLEVRSREVPFILEDGQIVGRLVYERLIEPPATLYGTELGSHYQAQGLKLSKHFRAA